MVNPHLTDFIVEFQSMHKHVNLGINRISKESLSNRNYLMLNRFFVVNTRIILVGHSLFQSFSDRFQIRFKNDTILSQMVRGLNSKAIKYNKLPCTCMTTKIRTLGI